MRSPARALLALSLLALPVALVFGGLSVHAQAYVMHVVMVDNAGPLGGTGQGYYSFAPQHFVATQGQQIVFDNPATARWPHSVASITWSGTGPFGPFRTLETGTLFDSSPTQADLIPPGASWTLETSGMPPAQYLYYCTVHPWMVGSFTLQPAGA